MSAAEILAVGSDTVGVIAGVVAAVVAVLGYVGTIVRRRTNRPALQVRFGDQSPLLKIEPSPTSPRWHQVRAEVRNVGEATAHDVRGRITNVWFRAEQAHRADGLGWEPLISLPVPLRWNSRSYRGSSGAGPIELTSQGVDYLDISRKSMQQSDDGYEHVLCGLGDEKENPSLHDRMMRIGEYRIEVTVVATNSQPVTNVVSYTQSLVARQLTQVHESEAPPPPVAPPAADMGAIYKGELPGSPQ